MSSSLAEIKRNIITPQSQRDTRQTTKERRKREIFTMDTEVAEICPKGETATKDDDGNVTADKASGDLPENMIDRLAGTIMRQVGEMIKACLAVVEQRFPPKPRLRPKLGKTKQLGKPQDKSKTVGKPAIARTATYAGMAATSLGKRSGPKKASAQTAVVEKTKTKQKETRGRSPEGDEWNLVSNRKKGKRKSDSDTDKSNERKKGKAQDANTMTAKPKSKGKGKEPEANNKKKIRVPKSAVIIITPKKGITRSKILQEARTKIRLEELGITHLRPRIAATGAVIIEVPDELNAKKTDKLTEKLRATIIDNRARITRSVNKADIRVMGLDESVTKEELAMAIADIGNCSPEGCKIGEIMRNSRGLGTVWVSCPAALAKRVVDSSRIKVGWVYARTEAMAPRPMTCFRCLEPGHTRARCTAPQDRGNRCYLCGEIRHVAKGCAEAPRCPLCVDLGLSAGHRKRSLRSPEKERKAESRNFGGVADHKCQGHWGRSPLSR